MKTVDFKQIGECLEKIEVLSDMYNDFGNMTFMHRNDLELAKLKMNLIKKEILMLTYQISKQIGAKC
jgi:hypothetical protein